MSPVQAVTMCTGAAPPREVRFFVPGIPRPGGSKRAFVTKTGRAVVVEDNKRSMDWRAVVALAAFERFRRPLEGPVTFAFRFVMPRPKSHFRTGRHAGELRPDAPAVHTSKPDASKLTRSTEDALKGIAWLDDSQVCDQVISKRYGESPGCWISVWEYHEER